MLSPHCNTVRSQFCTVIHIYKYNVCPKSSSAVYMHVCAIVCLMVFQLVMLYVCLLFGFKRSFVIHGCWFVTNGVMSLVVVLVS